MIAAKICPLKTQMILKYPNVSSTFNNNACKWYCYRIDQTPILLKNKLTKKRAGCVRISFRYQLDYIEKEVRTSF